MFDYDPNTPITLTEITCQVEDGVQVKDIRYNSPVTGQPLAAYLVSPENPHKAAAILFVHWYETHAENSNRTQFLNEAKQLAREHGVVSLLPETMWSELTWYQQGRSLESDFEDASRQVIELRRGLDVLLSVPGVEATRLAYVGHDFGAMYGTLMGGVDQRPRAYVLIAGASDFSKWMLYNVKPDDPRIPAYKEKMHPLAPTQWVAKLAPAPVLFQFGTDDFYTPQDDFEAYIAAAAEPKSHKLYPTQHAMDLLEIRADRLAFLREQLGL